MEHDKPSTLERCLFWWLLAVIFGITLWITNPSAEDVKKCVEETNYTAERCLTEMTR